MFAQQCQCKELTAHLAYIQDEDVLETIKNVGTLAFQEVCLNRTRPMQLKDLLSITRMVALGLRDRSRTQLHFPQDHTQSIPNHIKRKRESKARDFGR